MKDTREFAEHAISNWEKHYLRRGQNYRVNTSFIDADGMPHPVGEEWMFIGSKFSKFDDEYTLCVRFKAGNIGLLRLRSEPEPQHDVIKHFNQYVTPV